MLVVIERESVTELALVIVCAVELEYTRFDGPCIHTCCRR
jgi:hypothetical protein